MENGALKLLEKVNQIAAAAEANFSEASVGKTCIICPGEPCELALKIAWVARIPRPDKAMFLPARIVLRNSMGVVAGALMGHLWSGGYVSDKYFIKVRFNTFHSISLKGLQIVEHRWRVFVMMRAICRFFANISSFILAAGTISIFLNWTGWYENSLLWLPPLMIPCLCVLVVSILCFRYIRDFGLPTKTLESIAQRPIEIAHWTS